RTERIAVPRSGVTTEAIQKAMELALRVVEASCARPAVGAAVDGLVAVVVADALQLACDERDRLVPFDLDERVGAAPAVGTGSVLEPAAAYRGSCDARRAMDPVDEIREEGRRRGIVGVSVDADDAIVFDGHAKRAPVRHVGQRAAAFVRHTHKAIFNSSYPAVKSWRAWRAVASSLWRTT